MKVFALALALCLPPSALHAEWKVATVRMSELFEHFPEVKACKEQVRQKKINITQDIRAKALEEKRAEIQQLNLEWRKVLMDYQKRESKDDTGPEADRVRDYRTRRNLAESQLQALTLEFQDFQKEQIDRINKETALIYRKILDRLTRAAQEYAATQGYDGLYEISGGSHVGLPPLLYIKANKTTDLTDELKKKIDAGEIQ
jgi:Skp family chaperone for outer membrane proteins